MIVCRLCAEGLLHCHGTAVVHFHDYWECSDVGCIHGIEVHEIVVACREIDPHCCVEPRGV